MAEACEANLEPALQVQLDLVLSLSMVWSSDGRFRALGVDSWIHGCLLLLQDETYGPVLVMDSGRALSRCSNRKTQT